MTKHGTVRITWLLALVCVVIPAAAVAQEAGAEGVVFTNDELKKRLDDAKNSTVVFTNEDLQADEPTDEAEGESGDDGASKPTPAPAPVPRPQAAAGVFTNEDLKAAEPAARPDPQPAVPVEPTSGAFTNEDLKARFGGDESEAPAAAAADRAAVPPPPPIAVPTPATTENADVERQKQIAEIDIELKRLEKRLLAIRNPLLAGTAKANEEEAAAEAGMDNRERARRTEEKIGELRKTLNELNTDDD